MKNWENTGVSGLMGGLRGSLPSEGLRYMQLSPTVEDVDPSTERAETAEMAPFVRYPQMTKVFRSIEDAPREWQWPSWFGFCWLEAVG